MRLDTVKSDGVNAWAYRLFRFLRVKGNQTDLEGIRVWWGGGVSTLLYHLTAHPLSQLAVINQVQNNGFSNQNSTSQLALEIVHEFIILLPPQTFCVRTFSNSHLYTCGQWLG